jgi:glycerol uptake facilitator-like aquaporin
MGLAMGLTAIGIVMSPWGKQSGGHFNPAITLTYYRLGKVEFWDFWFYVAAQFVGAIAGVCAARYVLLGALGDDAVRYAVTVPGVFGRGIAFAAEVTISFLLMFTILVATNRASLERYTPFVVGALIATYIAFETPLSGMSTNPARTFSSALHANHWQSLWIYFVAPITGHAWGCRGLPACPERGLSLLREAPPLQRQTLYLSSRRIWGRVVPTSERKPVSTLQQRLDEFKAIFESGAPPYNAPREAIERMHRATAELKASSVVSRALKIDDRVPAFSLFNQDHVLVSLKTLLQDGPVVVSFFRGHW